MCQISKQSDIALRKKAARSILARVILQPAEKAVQSLETLTLGDRAWVSVTVGVPMNRGFGDYCFFVKRIIELLLFTHLLTEGSRV